MKKSLIGISALALGLAGAAYAADEMPGGDPLGDKTVTKAEFQAKGAAMFDKMDANHDGKLDAADRAAHEGAMFDAVIASEVIEHVSNVGSFLETCRRLCKPNGAIIVSTLNRTAKSYALAIVAAEKLLGLIPRGTHDWNKFIKPSELAAELKAARFALGVESGIVFSPLSGEWKLSDKDLSVNYIMSAKAV